MSGANPGLADPAGGALSITPSDSTPLSKVVRGIYVGGSGNLTVGFVDGTTATFYSVPTGQLLPIRVTQVYNTGTSCSNIVGLY